MKEWTEIIENTQVQMLNKVKTIDGDMQGIEGFLNLRDSKKTMSFMASIDNDGARMWEHVSVSYYGETKKTPTWAEMCAVKAVFWRDDDLVKFVRNISLSGCAVCAYVEHCSYDGVEEDFCLLGVEQWLMQEHKSNSF